MTKNCRNLLLTLLILSLNPIDTWSSPEYFQSKNTVEAREIENSPHLTPKQKEMISTLEYVASIYARNYAPLNYKNEKFGHDIRDTYISIRRQIESSPDLTVKEFRHELKKLIKSTRDYHVGIYFNSTELAYLPFSVMRVKGTEAAKMQQALLEGIITEHFDEKKKSTNDQDPSTDAGKPVDGKRIGNKNFQSIAFEVNDVSKEENSNESSVENVETTEPKIPYFYVIAYVDEEQLGTSLKVGDIVKKFGGEDIDKVVQSLRKNFHTNNERTDQRRAELSVTLRAGVFGDIVPKEGSTTVEVLSDGSKKSRTVNVVWAYREEEIPPEIPPMGKSFVHEPISLEKDKYEEKSMNVSMKMKAFDVLDLPIEQQNSYANNPHKMGSKKSFFSFDDGETSVHRLFKFEESPIDSYVFRTRSGKRVGFMRMHHWGFMDKEDRNKIDEIINYMEASTDGLIIDEANNPGGELNFSIGFVSRFALEAFPAAKHHWIVNESHVQHSIKRIKELENELNKEGDEKVTGYNINGLLLTRQDLQGMINFHRFKINQFKLGKRVTDPYPFWGLNNINPHPNVRYTKPVLMIINELAMSGGDFVPSMFQDAKRAAFFGQATMGAGGVVEQVTFPNHLGIASIGHTTSLAVRPNDIKIENVGVKPDIPYEVTLGDVRTGYSEMKKKLIESIEAMIESNQVD